ncbi:MAG: hypothetical protein M1818_002968 [Claussenomyces sp. TS43310]|nr:MAG: hypothetical protein M1818_002968 [Claussenomyces sp. TS43310]
MPPRIATFLTWLLVCSAFLVLDIHAYTPLTDESLKSLPSAGSDFDIHSGSLLAPLLIPRVPGTPGSLAAQQHFIDFFSTHLPEWTIEYQNSTGKTPVTGDQEVPFANLIMTRDPPWTRPGDVGRLTLAAHYDSKISPEGFIGATDSAAPCAMILHAARSVNEALTRKWEAMAAQGLDDGLQEETGLQILFLDGEEAFAVWTSTDSIYGARSLAEEWEHTAHPALSTYRTALSSITLFMLLDLLGSTDPSPHVPSYFKTTHWAYQYLANIESRLRSLSQLLTDPPQPFLPDKDKSLHSFFNSMIEDDHIPFMARGVEILHIIQSPFPNVWHTMNDDGEHLDLDSVEDWARIVTAFVAEWMDLEGHLIPTTQASVREGGERPFRKTEL